VSIVATAKFFTGPFRVGFLALCVSTAALSNPLEVTEWAALKQAQKDLVVFTSVQSITVKPGDLLRLATERGDTFNVQVERVRRTRLGNYSIAGTTASGGMFISVISPAGAVLGYLSKGYDSYHLSGANGKVFLNLQDPSLQPQRIDSGAAFLAPLQSPDHDGSIQYQGVELHPADGGRTADSNWGATKTDQQTAYPTYTVEPFIDVLIYYDDELEDPEGVIDYVVEYSNYIYQFTEMGIELRVADAIALAIDNETDNTALLEAMGDANPPFTSIASDRSNSRADLVHTLRVNKADNTEENCGIAPYSVYRGFPFRDLGAVVAVTEWRPPTESGNYFCSAETFTHEIGHNLGAAHQRDDYSPDDLAGVQAAYFYSHGSYQSGVYSTVMSVDEGRAVDLYNTFSTPLFACGGVACGVSPSEDDAADNRRTLMGTKFWVAPYEGAGFNYAAIYETPWSSTCEEETKGFRGVLVANNSKYRLEVKSRTFLESDGSVFFAAPFESGQFVLEPGGNGAWGYCRDDEDQPIGSIVTEAFFTYENPVTGEEVEGTHVFFDNDYEGDYALVKALAGKGGSVVGNPSLHSRVDEEVELTFEPDYGFKLARISGTCPGSLHNKVFTAEPSYGDCWAVAEFEPLSGSEFIEQRFDDLLDSVLMVRKK